MKRSIVILALVTAITLTFAAVAQATYRGFTPLRSQAQLDDEYLQGFITFPEARSEMNRNGVPMQLQNTVHGGYITTTTKCAICHSAHRASGVNPNATTEGTTLVTLSGNDLANARDQYFLTAGQTTCLGCHTPSGSQSSRLLVEWGTQTGGEGGPHTRAGGGRGCTMCHNAGIHGLTSSQFNVMNVYMLGNTRRSSDGSPTNTGDETRDAQIIREINEGRVLRGMVLDVPPNSETFPSGTNIFNSPNRNPYWWYDGARSLGATGETPITGALGSGAPIRLPAPNFGAARSLATAYTCSESGCHVNTVMFNLNWGMGFDRDNSLGDTHQITGHILPSIRVAGAANRACGPCHSGSPAGFPTASTNQGARDVRRTAYGCDQCHDMVGVATNSTAWPHGNRNIVVYEWLADGTQQENMMAAGNLWMYGGNIARSADALSLGPTGTGINMTLPQGSQSVMQEAIPNGGSRFWGPTSNNVSFADQSWQVLTGVTSGRNGLPGTGTGLLDGSCLKCHVSLDSASREALGSVGADALNHAWTQGWSPGSSSPFRPAIPVLDNPSWNGSPVSGSQRLFLYR